MVSLACRNISRKNLTGGHTSSDSDDVEALQQKVIEWDGTFWKTLENDMCTRKGFHKTFVYRGEIYLAGRLQRYEDDVWPYRWTDVYNR